MLPLPPIIRATCRLRTTTLHFFHTLNQVETLELRELLFYWRRRVGWWGNSPPRSFALNILHQSHHLSTDWRRWWRSPRVSKRTATRRLLLQSKATRGSLSGWKPVLQTRLWRTASSNSFCTTPYQQVWYTLKRDFRSKAKNDHGVLFHLLFQSSIQADYSPKAAHLALNIRCFTLPRQIDHTSERRPPVVNTHTCTSALSRQSKSCEEPPQHLVWSTGLSDVYSNYPNITHCPVINTDIN